MRVGAASSKGLYLHMDSLLIQPEQAGSGGRVGPQFVNSPATLFENRTLLYYTMTRTEQLSASPAMEEQDTSRNLLTRITHTPSFTYPIPVLVFYNLFLDFLSDSRTTTTKTKPRSYRGEAIHPDWAGFVVSLDHGIRTEKNKICFADFQCLYRNYNFSAQICDLLQNT